MASAPTCSPDKSLGRYFFRWASLPFRLIWLTHRLECAPYDRPTEAEPREISSMGTQGARYPMPEPPYSSSTVMPCKPSAPICGHRSRGKVLVLSISSARGAILSSEKRRVVHLAMSCL